MRFDREQALQAVAFTLKTSCARKAPCPSFLPEDVQAQGASGSPPAWGDPLVHLILSVSAERDGACAEAAAGRRRPHFLLAAGGAEAGCARDPAPPGLVTWGRTRQVPGRRQHRGCAGSPSTRTLTSGKSAAAAARVPRGALRAVGRRAVSLQELKGRAFSAP